MSGICLEVRDGNKESMCVRWWDQKLEVWVGTVLRRWSTGTQGLRDLLCDLEEVYWNPRFWQNTQLSPIHGWQQQDCFQHMDLLGSAAQPHSFLLPTGLAHSWICVVQLFGGFRATKMGDSVRVSQRSHSGMCNKWECHTVIYIVFVFSLQALGCQNICSCYFLQLHPN